MTTIDYTHEFNDFDSSLVDNVWYDETTQKAAIDLNDSIYVYSNVPLSAVEDLVSSSSIGRAFNGQFMSTGFKKKFGPGEYVGGYYDVDLVERGQVAATAPTLTSNPNLTNTTTTNGLVGKNLTYANTATLDGAPVNPNYVNLHAEPEPTKGGKHLGESVEPVRIPLKVDIDTANDALNALVTASKTSYTVHFESNGPKTYDVEATAIEDAVDSLLLAAEILDVDVTVTGVFVHFV